MKKILFFVLIFICVKGFGQSTVLLRGDTIRVYKQGGTAVLKVDSILWLSKYRPGASTDSVLTWDPVGKTVKMIDQSGLGGGSGSGTVNSGLLGKPAYYITNPNGTVVDDFAPIDYSLTGAHQIITAQNTTDTNLVLKGTSAQTAPFFAARNSGGTVVTQITKDGYGWFPAGSASANSQGIKVGSTGIFDLGTGLGYYFGGGSGYQAALGEFGLLFAQVGSVIDIGQSATFGTTNRIRMSAPAEGTVKFHSLGLTAATIIKGTGGEGTSSSLYLEADEADDGADTWKLTSETGNDFTFTNNVTEYLRIISTGGLRMPEISAPSTPASATAVIYPKSDGLWYGKDDAGLETQLSNAAGATPTLQQVLDAGSTLGSNETISVGANTLIISATSGGLYVASSASQGLYAESSSQSAAGFTTVLASTNTIVPIIELYRQTSGTAADGIGGSLPFYTETDNGNLRIGNEIASELTIAADGTRTARMKFTGVNSASIVDKLYIGSNYIRANSIRFQNYQGTDVASVAGAIALDNDGNTFEITGTNAVTLISNLGWQNGSEVTLIFTSTATLTDGTANSGTDIGMELLGGLNFIATADDVVTLVLCEVGGTQRWREKSRSIN